MTTRDPPVLNKVLPSLADIKAITKPSKDADLPVDILLLTVTNCEFLACYSELKNPYRCWFDSLGYVYFSDVGESQEELKVALLRCYRSDIGPGGALVSVKNAASVLRPKAVISVGACSGLNPAKSKLGDVLVSTKLATYASRVVTNNQEQSTSMKSYVSKRFLNVIKNCADGWQAPFENPETQQVQVYTDAEFLSGPEQVRAEWRRDQLAETSPQAMAIENEGEGVFTAAFDCQIEWLIVKGIADYADGSQLPSESWSSCASVLAASLVAHILSEPCVFHSWPHYQDISEQSSASRSSPPDSPCPNDIIEKIRELYRTCEKRSHPIPWRRDFSFHLNKIFTKLKIVRKGKTQGLLLPDATTDITAIFRKQGDEPPRKVLIEGDPGMGKSMYCQKLAYDWATGQGKWHVSFPKIQVLLLLRCREMKSNIWEAISDQILPAGMDERAKDCFFSFVLKNQEEVLLLLDGLGEAIPNSLEVISNLWKSRDVLNCYIILLSHQEIGREFRSRCDSLWEIKGFTKKDATEFIRKYFNLINKEHLSKKLLEKIGLRSYQESGSADLYALTSSPLNTTLLCLLYDDYEGALPESRAELYIEYVLCVLRRYETNCGKRSKFEDLLGVHKKSLSRLGSMAFQSLLNGESHIELSESDSDFIVLSKLGFISLQAKGEMRKRLMRYVFIHDSFQEFFSGLYLAWQISNRDCDCDSVVTDQRYRNKLYKTFFFMTGILASRNEEAAKFLVESMARNINSASCQADEVLFASRCLSQCTRVAHVLGKQLNLTCLHLKEVKMDDSIFCFSKALAANSSLTNLSLKSTAIGDSGAASISQVLKDNSSLTDLNLELNDIRASGAASLAEALKGNISLTNLDLSWNSIGLSGAASLAEALEANSSLTTLNLRGNSIGNTGAAALSQTLKASRSLTHLNLSGNKIGASGMALLSRALKANSSLTDLNLSYNEIGAKGTTLLAMSLNFKSSLTHLNLRCNNIGAKGAKALSQALQAKFSLTHLNLMSNSIGDDGAVSLFNAVAVNSSLKSLDLCSNGIDDSVSTTISRRLVVNHLTSVRRRNVYLCLAGLMTFGALFFLFKLLITILM